MMIKSSKVTLILLVFLGNQICLIKSNSEPIVQQKEEDTLVETNKQISSQLSKLIQLKAKLVLDSFKSLDNANSDKFLRLNQRLIDLGSKFTEQFIVIEEFKRQSYLGVRKGSIIVAPQSIKTFETTNVVTGGSVVGSPEVYFDNGKLNKSEWKSILYRSTNYTLASTQYLSSIKQKLDKVVFTNKRDFVPNQVIISKLNCPQVISKSMIIHHHAGYPFNAFLDNIVRRRHYRDAIKGQIVFKQTPLVFQATVNRVNRISPRRDLVLQNSRNVIISSPLRIGSLSSINIMSNYLNRWTPHDFIFINGPELLRLTSPIIFARGVRINGYLYSELISNIHLKRFSQSILTRNTDQQITRPVSARLLKSPEIKLKRKLNGIDFQMRASRLIRVNKPIKMAELILTSRTIRAKEFNVGRINSHLFPGDFLISNPRKTQRIVSPKVFKTIELVRTTNINGLVNRLSLSDSFVTLNGNENVDSEINFIDSVSFNNNVHTFGQVGRHKVIDLIKWTADKDVRSLIKKNNPKGNVIIQGHLNVVQAINGINLGLLLADSVNVYDTKPIRVTGRKTFISPISVSSLSVSTINDWSLSSFESIGNRPVSVPIRLTKPLGINNLIIKSNPAHASQNEFLELINKRISLTHKGPILGDIFFEELGTSYLVINEEAHHRINNIQPSKLVTRSKPQFISAQKIISRGASFVRPFQAYNVFISKNLNSRSIHFLNSSRLNMSKKNVTIRFEKLTLRSSHINQLNLTPSKDSKEAKVISLLRNTLLNNGNQVFAAQKRFLSKVEFGHNIKFRSTKGFVRGSLGGDLFLRPTIDFNIPVSFRELIVFGNVEVDGKVNNLDVRVPLDLQVYNSKWSTFSASQTFSKGFFANNILIDKLNGRDLKSYLLKYGRQILRLPVRARNVEIRGLVNVNGLVNKMDLLTFANHLRHVKVTRKATIYGPVIFTDQINVQSNLKVSGRINNYDYKWLTRDLVRESRETILGVKTIPSAYFRKNLIVKKLNGYRVDSIINDIVLAHPNSSIIIPGPVEFTKHSVIKGNINQDTGRINFIRLVNGLYLDKIIRNAFWFSTQPNSHNVLEFIGPVEIQSSKPISIKGRLNGLNLRRDIIWNRNIFSPYQVIKGRKTFSRAHFIGEVNVQGRFNGVPWSSRLRSTVNHGQQSMNHHVRLGERANLEKGVIINKISGISTSQLIPINHPNMIVVNGLWVFHRHLQIDRDLNIYGKIKNVSLSELALYSLRKNVPQTINVPLTFERVAIRDTNLIKSLIDDYRSVQQSHFDYWSGNVTQKIKRMVNFSGENLIASDNVTRFVTANVPAQITGFRVFQRLPKINGQTIDIHSTNSFSIGSVAHSQSLVTHFTFAFDETSQKFIEKGVTHSSMIDTERFTLDGKTYELQQSAINSVNRTVIILGKQIIGNLGLHYDDLKIMSFNGKAKIISALSSVRGVVETFTLGIVNQRIYFHKISTLNVSPTARKISLFQIRGEIYLAVARSVSNDCELEESGSLLFHWLEKKNFKLIQRFPYFEASNVVHYSYNKYDYLVFSDDRPLIDRLDSPKGIHIYQSRFSFWPDCQFVHFQSLNFDQTDDLQAFTVMSGGWPIQLLAAINHSKLQVWQQQGNSGFSKIWSTSLLQGKTFKFILFKQKLLLIVATVSNRSGSLIFEALT